MKKNDLPMPSPINYIVKINIYKGVRVDEVVYYRYDLPWQIFLQFQWYFEFLAAKVKVKHPHERVELIMKQNSDQFLAGDYYKAKKSKTLLSAKKGQLKKLQSQKYQDDLFGSVTEQREMKIKKLQQEISNLEDGKFNYWYPGTYKNVIKKYI